MKSSLVKIAYLYTRNVKFIFQCLIIVVFFVVSAIIKINKNIIYTEWRVIMKSKFIALSVIFALCTQSVFVYATEGKLNLKKEFNHHYTYDDSINSYLIDEQNSSSNNIACSPWARESIENAILAGIIPDTLQSNYTDKITRKEFCHLAVQTYMAKTGYTIQPDLQSPFTDIDDDYITTAYMLDIVSGVGNDKFAPNNNITRQEAAVMLNNLAGAAGVDNSKVNTEKFVDENYFADWAEDAIYKVSAIDSNGTAVMTGTGRSKFSPWMNYTREQAATTMYRLYNCKAMPVLIPQADNNIYYVNNNKLYRFDTENNSVRELASVDEENNGKRVNVQIITVSGNEIYYKISSGNTLIGESESIICKIKTDGTGNATITPKAMDTYLGHRYIYYSPIDRENTVVRTNLDGTNPVVADFSKICGDKGWCHTEADNGDTAYINVNTGTYYERYDTTEHLYTYDFSRSSAAEISIDTNTECMRTEALTDGKYIYYVHRDVWDTFRYQTDYVLHRCNADATNDVELKNLSYAYIYNFYGAVRLNKNKVYVYTDLFSDEPNTPDYCFYVYGDEGEKRIEHKRNGNLMNAAYFIGISNDKIYYIYEGSYHTINVDGTNDVELKIIQ